jgi:hypothetical protein
MMRWELRRDGRTMSLRATLLAVALVPACGGGGAGDAADAPDAATSPGPDGATVVDAIVADAAPPDATPLPIVTTGSITAGFGHTCVLHPTGRVKCWGQGGQGQLGLGDTTSRGDAPGELGADLPAVDLGTDRYATALAGGGNHTCALLDDHRVKCWGYATDGQLGLGDVDARGDGPGEMGGRPPYGRPRRRPHRVGDHRRHVPYLRVARRPQREVLGLVGQRPARPRRHAGPRRSAR